MKNLKNIIFILVVIAFIFQIFTMQTKTKKNDPISKPLVSLSTFSLYDIARHVAGDSVELVMILPFGVDAHSFEPTPKLMAKISKSDLVVYSGAGLEPWTDGFDFKGKVIDMSGHVKLRKLDSHHQHHGEAHKLGSFDPHYWLDISNMIVATNIITDELIKISPKNKTTYMKNRDSYLLGLKKLDDDYKQKLSTCQGDTIIVNHNAFSYMANNYSFHVEALSGLSPEAQPSAKKMIELIEHVKEHNISTIFFESFVSDKAIKSIASEANVEVDVLQPLGNITANEAKQKLSFEDIMRQNLQKISKALKCQ
jgi:zinc transport system substrate-binding protein